MIRNFKVTVTREDEYVIELDDEVINSEWMADYSRYFHHVEELEEIAKSLAWFQMRNGNDRFIEGFGNVTRDGSLPFCRSDFDEKGNWLPENQRARPAAGLNIVVEIEDDDYQFNVEEVQP